MRSVRVSRRGAACLAALLLTVIGFYPGVPVAAEGGFALSGSFYAQEFELPQGSSLQAPDVYVVVFNNSASASRIKMTTQAPLGVELLLSEDDFELEAGGQKKVTIGLQVTREAAPGEYEISITAEPYAESVSGIQILGAAGQSANLVVVGEAARIKAQTVNPAGNPVSGAIHLYKLSGGHRFEVAYSETGVIDTSVAPGSYAATAYLRGEELAEESFDVVADEEKTVSLTVETVYFESFGVVPNYRKGTQDLTFAQVVYTVKNLYQPVEKAEVVLKVSHPATPPDQVSLATLSPLEMGRVGLSYNYIPADGWAGGNYGFELALLLDGEPYTATPVETLNVSQPGATSGPGGSAASTWWLLGGIAVVAAVAGAGRALLVRRRD